MSVRSLIIGYRLHIKKSFRELKIRQQQEVQEQEQELEQHS